MQLEECVKNEESSQYFEVPPVKTRPYTAFRTGGKNGREVEIKKELPYPAVSGIEARTFCSI